MLSAVAIRQFRQDNGALRVTTESGDVYRARAVILAPGSSYRRLGVPAREELIGAGIHFCATCDGSFYRGAQELMIIVGGNSGVEEGMFLSQFARQIRLIEFDPELKASSLLQEKVRSDPRFEVHTNTEVMEFRKANGHQLGAVVVRDRSTGEIRAFRPAAAFVFIGMSPNTEFQPGPVGLHLDRPAP